MDYRELISAHARHGETTLKQGVDRAVLEKASRMLARHATPLPADYADFLAQTNGLDWNGVELFGLTGKRGPRDLIMRNEFMRIARPDLPPRLYIGESESYRFAHSSTEGGYCRFFKGPMTIDAGFGAPSFSGFLTNLFESRKRLGLDRPDHGLAEHTLH